MLEVENESPHILWNLPQVEKNIKKQLASGSWMHKGKQPGEEFDENYELVETWKQLRILIHMYGLNRTHPSASKAVEFLFSCQTEEGGIRGILSNQYTPYYMGAILELLIKAGYSIDERVEKGLIWVA